MPSMRRPPTSITSPGSIERSTSVNCCASSGWARISTPTRSLYTCFSAEAAEARIRHELEAGRSGKEHFEELKELAAAVREKVALPFGCTPERVALTRSTTDGVNTVLTALELGPGDEVLTTDEEHPG